VVLDVVGVEGHHALEGLRETLYLNRLQISHLSV
jgi:hypothetical protein